MTKCSKHVMKISRLYIRTESFEIPLESTLIELVHSCLSYKAYMNDSLHIIILCTIIIHNRVRLLHTPNIKCRDHNYFPCTHKTLYIT